VTITPFAVNLFGTRVYDGVRDGDSSILAVTNAFAGDTVTVASGTSTIASKNVGNENIVNFGTLTLGGATAGDYTLIGATGLVVVTPEPLIVTAVPVTKTSDGTPNALGTPIVTSGTVFTGDTGGFVEAFNTSNPGTGLTLTPSGVVDDGNNGNNYTVTYVSINTGVINAAVTTMPPIVVPTQTSSGNGTTSNVMATPGATTATNGGILTITAQQNGIVTGTIATIDGNDYHPDAQLGCTLGAAGCVQNGVAPSNTSAPPQ
jgi:hypothetical protein